MTHINHLDLFNTYLNRHMLTQAVSLLDAVTAEYHESVAYLTEQGYVIGNSYQGRLDLIAEMTVLLYEYRYSNPITARSAFWHEMSVKAIARYFRNDAETILSDLQGTASLYRTFDNRAMMQELISLGVSSDTAILLAKRQAS